MNVEPIKRKLLQIIEEATTLPSSEITGIPGTSILVKRGREIEFENLAQAYYELKYKPNDLNDFSENILEEVYFDLLSEQKKDNNPVESLVEEKSNWKSSEESHANENLIKTIIIEYLTPLIKKARKYPNSPKMDDQEILQSDMSEYHILQEICTILNEGQKRSDIKELDGIKIVNDPAIITRYKELWNQLKQLHSVDFTANEELMEEFYKEKKDLLQQSNEYQAQKEADLLEKASSMLASAKTDRSFIPVNITYQKKQRTIYLQETQINDFENIIREIFQIRGNRKQKNLTANTEAQKKIDQRLNELLNSTHPQNEWEEIKKLEQLRQVLKVNPNLEVTEINGLKINVDNKQNYQELLKQLSNLKEPNKERKKIKMVRKVANQKWWQQHGQEVAIIGLSLTVASYSLVTLAPTIVYMNSCLATRTPELANTIGTLNNHIVNLFGLDIANLNLDVASTHTISAILTAFAKIGLIGGGILATKKALDTTNKERLNNPKDKKIIIDNIKTIANDLLGQIAKIKKDVISSIKPNRGDNSSSKEDALFAEIQANVERRIAQEDRQDEEERKRKTEQNPHSNYPEMERVTIPSNEEISALLNGISLGEENVGRGRS